MKKSPDVRRQRIRAILFGASQLAMVAAGGSAFAQTADVIHSWTSGGESKAIAVIADEYKKRGGTWIDTAVTGIQAGRALATNRIAGGTPPTAMQWTVSKAVQGFAAQGLLSDLDETAKAGNWQALYAPYLYENMQADGHVIIVPVGIHGGSWMFYSPAVLADVGVEPPTSFAEFLAMADKIKAKGYTPLAFSSEAWTQALVLYNVMLDVGGQDFYKKIFIDHDAAAAKSETMVKAFETYAKLKPYVDAGVTGRKWNAATNMVITNKAAIQITGDWVKAEFINAGLVPGKDFGCQLAPGTKGSYILYVDGFAFPKAEDENNTKARALFVDVLMDPKVSADFNMAKGSVPPRSDVKLPGADACSALAQETLANPNVGVPNGALAFNSDMEGQIRDLVTEFWATDMKPEDAANRLADILAGG